MSATRPHPQVHTQQWVWLECADCGTDSHDQGTPHFAGEAEALLQILGEDGYGWTERADGRPLEQAELAVQRYRDDGWSYQRIAASLGPFPLRWTAD